MKDTLCLWLQIYKTIGLRVKRFSNNCLQIVCDKNMLYVFFVRPMFNSMFYTYERNPIVLQLVILGYKSAIIGYYLHFTDSILQCSRNYNTTTGK